MSAAESAHNGDLATLAGPVFAAIPGAEKTTRLAVVSQGDLFPVSCTERSGCGLPRSRNSRPGMMRSSRSMPWRSTRSRQTRLKGLAWWPTGPWCNGMSGVVSWTG